MGQPQTFGLKSEQIVFIFFFLFKSCPTTTFSVYHLERNNKEIHLFSYHPFHTDVQLLLDASDRPITEQRRLHAQTTVIRASAAEVYLCKQKRDLNKQTFPQFTENYPKFPASLEENVPMEGTAPADGPHQVTPTPACRETKGSSGYI